MFKIIEQLIKMNIKKWMEYRIDFFVGIIAIFLTNIVSIFFFWVVFQQIPTLNGWTFNQLLFLLGIEYLAFGIWHTFFSGISPHRMERYIVNGEFDFLLLKPFNPMLAMILGNMDDDGLGDLIAGVLVFAYASNALSIVWSLQNILLIILTMFGSVLIIFSLNILMSTATFWVVRARMLSDVFWPLIRFTEFPLDIYNPIIIFALTFVLPLGFINYYPAQMFLGKGVWRFAAYLTPLVGLLMFFVSYAVWRFGIKNYTSTGS